MAAEIIEQEHLDNTDTDDLPVSGELSTEELVTEFSAPDTTLEPPADEIPDKYKGKDIREIVTMHQEAEKLIGKHSGEVGELRSMVDGYIKTNLQAANPPAEPEPEVDFFEDPETAVSNAIQRHPDVVAARTESQKNRQATAFTQLQAKHPDMGEVLQDPAFGEWVQGSRVRTELFQRADRDYDFDCADDLITQYKNRVSVVQQAQQAEQTQRQQTVKAAQTGSGSGSNTAGAKRIYRRADIIKLMKTDPDRYEALSPEIMEAYRTGRVK
jgi:hypothetical protein